MELFQAFQAEGAEVCPVGYVDQEEKSFRNVRFSLYAKKCKVKERESRSAYDISVTSIFVDSPYEDANPFNLDVSINAGLQLLYMLERSKVCAEFVSEVKDAWKEKLHDVISQAKVSEGDVSSVVRYVLSEFQLTNIHPCWVAEYIFGLGLHLAHKEILEEASSLNSHESLVRIKNILGYLSAEAHFAEENSKVFQQSVGDLSLHLRFTNIWLWSYSVRDYAERDMVDSQLFEEQEIEVSSLRRQILNRRNGISPLLNNDPHSVCVLLGPVASGKTTLKWALGKFALLEEAKVVATTRDMSNGYAERRIKLIEEMDRLKGLLDKGELKDEVRTMLELQVKRLEYEFWALRGVDRHKQAYVLSAELLKMSKEGFTGKKFFVVDENPIAGIVMAICRQNQQELDDLIFLRGDELYDKLMFDPVLSIELSHRQRIVRWLCSILSRNGLFESLASTAYEDHVIIDVPANVFVMRILNSPDSFHKSIRLRHLTDDCREGGECVRAASLRLVYQVLGQVLGQRAGGFMVHGVGRNGREKQVVELVAEAQLRRLAALNDLYRKAFKPKETKLDLVPVYIDVDRSFPNVDREIVIDLSRQVRCIIDQVREDIETLLIPSNYIAFSIEALSSQSEKIFTHVFDAL